MWAVVASAVLAPATTFADDYARLPAAITINELSGYCQLLKLSDEQRIGVELKHDAYLETFEPMRAEMLDIALQFPRQGQRGSDEEFLRHLLPFVRSMRAFDAGFFDSVSPLLIPDQSAMLARVRMMRERTMCARLDVVGRCIGEGIPDLRELLESIKPAPELLLIHAPKLDEYERRLTQGIRAVFEASIAACTSRNPDSAEVLIELVQSLRTMNRETAERLGSLLPPELAVRWRDSFHRRAYAQAVSSAQMFVLPQLEIAHSLPDLTESERQQLNQLQQTARSAYDQAVAELCEMLDREAIAASDPRGAVAGAGYVEVINATRRESMLLDAEPRKSLQALLGPERSANLRQARLDPVRSQSSWRYACGVVAYITNPPGRTTAQGVLMGRADPLLTFPITTAEVAEYVTAMNLDSERRDILMASHADYLAALQSELDPKLKDRARFEVHLPPEQRAGRDPLERATSVQQLQSTIRSIVERADGRFFESVQSLLGFGDDDAAWKCVFGLRSRSRAALNLALRTSPDPSRAAEIDVIAVLMRQPAGWQAYAALGDLAAEYESQSLAHRTATRDAYAQYDFEERARRDGWRGERELDHQGYRDRSESLHAMHHGLAQLNQTYVARFAQILPAEQAAALNDAFNRAAYPDAFADPANMDDALQGAMALAGLSHQQREALIQISADFNRSSQDVTRRIINLCAATPPDMPMVGRTMTPERTKAHEKFEIGMAQLSEERATINGRALRGLRMNLSAAQLRGIQIPDLE